MLSDGKLAIGVLLGILVRLAALFFFEFFGLSIDASSELVASLLGTLIGGSIAILVQVLAQHNEHEIKKKEKEESQLKLLLSVWEKAKEIHSNLAAYRKHFDECIEDRSEYEVPNKNISVIPLSGKPTARKLDPQEKALPLLLGSIDLNNELADLDHLVEATISAFSKYEEEREKLMKLISLNFESNKIQIAFDPANEIEVRGRMNALDSSLSKIDKYLESDLNKALCA